MEKTQARALPRINNQHKPSKQILKEKEKKTLTKLLQFIHLRFGGSFISPRIIFSFLSSSFRLLILAPKPKSYEYQNPKPENDFPRKIRRTSEKWYEIDPETRVLWGVKFENGSEIFLNLGLGAFRNLQTTVTNSLSLQSNTNLIGD